MAVLVRLVAVYISGVLLSYLIGLRHQSVVLTDCLTLVLPRLFPTVCTPRCSLEWPGAEPSPPGWKAE